MTNFNLHSFANDIRDLYCKTGFSEIESIFIKISQAHIGSLAAWLRSNDGLKSKLKNSSVYEAFWVMLKIRNKYPENVTTRDILMMLMGKRDADYIPIIASFSRFLSDENFNNILSPFKDIIMACTNFTSEAIIDFQSIFDDLTFISNSFNKFLETQIGGGEYVERVEDGAKTTVKETKKTKIKNIFEYLLRRFSSTLASAAEQSEMPELASKFREGYLARPLPLGLGDYIKFNAITSSQSAIAQKLVSYIEKNPDEGLEEAYYNLIEKVLLNAAGRLSDETFYKFKEYMEKSRDVSKYMGIPENKNTELEEFKSGITPSDLLNPSYIYMLNIFFFVMLQKIEGTSPIMF